MYFLSMTEVQRMCDKHVCNKASKDDDNNSNDDVITRKREIVL